MRCFGHRGAKGHAPENTIVAFKKALELGLTWVELDVQVVGGELYVYHDAWVNSFKPKPKRFIDLTKSEVNGLDVGGGEKVPLLQEVLAQFGSALSFNIEMKGLDVSKSLAPFLSKSSFPYQQWIVSSFNIRDLCELHRTLPDVPIGLLYYGLPRSFKDDVKSTAASSIHLSSEFVTKGVVEEIHDQGLKVFVYTVNEVQDIEVMRALQVDGVFSDFPERVR